MGWSTCRYMFLFRLGDHPQLRPPVAALLRPAPLRQSAARGTLWAQRSGPSHHSLHAFATWSNGIMRDLYNQRKLGFHHKLGQHHQQLELRLWGPQELSYHLGWLKNHPQTWWIWGWFTIDIWDLTKKMNVTIKKSDVNTIKSLDWDDCSWMMISIYIIVLKWWFLLIMY